jgi:hypothetical protein
MATIRLSISPGQTLEQVTEATGLATVTGLVELTYDQGASAVTDAAAPGGVRAQKVAEIQQCIRTLEQYLLRQADVAWG